MNHFSGDRFIALIFSTLEAIYEYRVFEKDFSLKASENPIILKRRNCIFMTGSKKQILFVLQSGMCLVILRAIGGWKRK